MVSETIIKLLLGKTANDQKTNQISHHHLCHHCHWQHGDCQRHSGSLHVGSLLRWTDLPTKSIKMYLLSDSLQKVPGIGKTTAHQLAQLGINNILEFLLFVPNRYEDRSHIITIDLLQIEQIHTVKARVVSVDERFKAQKNKKLRITTAIIEDDTGRTKCIWFNNRFIKNNLKIGEEYFFAGNFGSYYNFTQPVVESVKLSTAHTGRLVPIYPQTTKLKQGNIRRWLKMIVDDLEEAEDGLVKDHQLLNITTALKQLHFPENEELVIKARERLAIEELLSLIDLSTKIKSSWQERRALASPAPLIHKFLKANLASIQDAIPSTVPFTLTNQQQQALFEILGDLTQPWPMNRLLVGDVGTGKTVVAGAAAWQMAQAGYNSALIAPTQILAEQHLQTFRNLFPKLNLTLLTSKTSKNSTKKTKNSTINTKSPTLFIGTHSVINRLDQINPTPALVIYDEQHRFGVSQRAISNQLTTKKQPHVLTMSATPIPRSYMLTIFSHLELSLITQSPFGPKETKSWFVPKNKHESAYQWLFEQLSENSDQKLAMVICPFINPSTEEGFQDIPSATNLYQQFSKRWSKLLKIVLLHGQQKPAIQEKVIAQLFNNEVDLLIATSIVEVGVDLPQANIMVIEGADRFGLASLHQLRGRVGRLGQDSYCLLFSSSNSAESKKRLGLFAKENDGLKLAEIDLKNRGPGNLFGLEQHGFETLRFASWNNATLIKKANDIYQSLTNPRQSQQYTFLFNQFCSNSKTDTNSTVQN